MLVYHTSDPFAALRELVLRRKPNINGVSLVALLEAFFFIPRDIDLSLGAAMTGKALPVVKEGEHDANATTIRQLLLYNVISHPGMIFLNGVKELLFLSIRLVIRVSGRGAGRANLP